MTSANLVDLLFGRARCETFGDLAAWLDEAGLTVDRLPARYRVVQPRAIRDFLTAVQYCTAYKGSGKAQPCTTLYHPVP